MNTHVNNIHSYQYEHFTKFEYIYISYIFPVRQQMFLFIGNTFLFIIGIDVKLTMYFISGK